MMGVLIVEVVFKGVALVGLICSLHRLRKINKKLDNCIEKSDKQLENLIKSDEELDYFPEQSDEKFDAMAVRLAGPDERLTRHDEQPSRQDERLASQGEQPAVHGELLNSHGERPVAGETDIKAFRGEFATFRTETNECFDRVDERFDRIDERFDRLDAKLDAGFAEIRELIFRFCAPSQSAAESPAGRGNSIEESSAVPELSHRDLGDELATLTVAPFGQGTSASQLASSNRGLLFI